MKRQGSLIIRDRAPQLLSQLSINPLKEPAASETKRSDKADKNANKNASRLTASETQRNIGSVTFFLDAKQFEENSRTKSFSTTELWLPIRDITITPNAKLSVSGHTKLTAHGMCRRTGMRLKTNWYFFVPIQNSSSVIT